MGLAMNPTKRMYVPAPNIFMLQEILAVLVFLTAVSVAVIVTFL